MFVFEALKKKRLYTWNTWNTIIDNIQKNTLYFCQILSLSSNVKYNTLLYRVKFLYKHVRSKSKKMYCVWFWERRGNRIQETWKKWRVFVWTVIGLRRFFERSMWNTVKNVLFISRSYFSYRLTKTYQTKNAYEVVVWSRTADLPYYYY